ncbi:NAD-dependent epimerase/dehydratase family protein [Patescibacteria group bacterium]|nr:NAD-dependent epimerase/dehydratase family protein [Patescibacteria group bacterium]MBU1682473.1 NAD-dependent epimerase/dehydratase family protein [Patescibacteria group bacterium]MBU1935367.1 NAD-dependent epimerase/dehydratase family protein [Patescibacteria group bacterium]
MEKILVTGGAGFIGSNFCNINKDKYEIIALDNLFLGDEKNLDPEIKFIKGDACNLEDLDKVGPVDYVVHLAGTSSAPMFMGDGLIDGYVNSIQSFITVLEWARKNGAKRVLYASTSSLYGNNPLPLVETQEVTPINHYAVTKRTYEYSSKCYNKVFPEMDIIGFRFMSVYGPNEEAKGKFANLISQFCWDFAREKVPVIYGDGDQTRDFTNVRDVVQGLTLAIETDKKLGADVFNIGTGYSVSVKEIADALEKAFDNGIQAKHIPNPVKEDYVMGQHADISKIKKVLGYEPKIKLEDGIKEQVENLRMDRIRETSSDELR